MVHFSSIGHAQTFPKRLGSASNAAAQTGTRSLELRVMVDEKAAIGTRHQWMQALAEVGADRLIAERPLTSQNQRLRNSDLAHRKRCRLSES